MLGWVGGMLTLIFRSKLAKLKRTTAKDLGKRSKPLGRRFSTAFPNLDHG